MTLCLLLLAPALLGIGAAANAQDADALAKQANSDLRAAQSCLFSGDLEGARAKLKGVAGILKKIKASNPRHRMLRSLGQRFGRLQRDLDRRSRSAGRRTPGKPTQGRKAGRSSPPATGPKLPGGVTFRLKKIFDILDRGKKGDPFKLMEEIDKRYGKAIPPDHPTITAVRKRLAELKRSREASARERAAKNAALRVAREARTLQGRKWVARLYPFLDYKSKSYLIDSTENIRATSAQKKKRASNYKAAAAAIAEYEKTEFPHGRTSELEDVVRRLGERLEAYRHDMNQVAIEQASASWLKELNRFVMPYDSEKSRVNRDRLQVPSTQDPNELKRLKGLFGKAKAVMAEYEKATFPLGQSRKLQIVAQELKQLIRVFPAEYQKNALRLLASPAKALEESERILAGDRSSLADPKVKPRTLAPSRIAALNRLVAKAGSVAGGDAAAFETLKKRLAALLVENARRRQLCTARTFMLPTRYAGDETDAVYRKVDEVLAAKVPGGKILRRTIPSTRWKEERVWEWTDTTRSAMRYRVTRSLTVQAAVKSGGKVTLHTLHIAKDRRSGGSWSPLHGHVMFANDMLEANVEAR